MYAYCELRSLKLSVYMSFLAVSLIPYLVYIYIVRDILCVCYCLCAIYCYKLRAYSYSYSESLIYHREAALMSIPRIVEVMSQELGWSSERCQKETRDSIAFMQSFGGSRPLQHHGNNKLYCVLKLYYTNGV